MTIQLTPSGPQQHRPIELKRMRDRRLLRKARKLWPSNRGWTGGLLRRMARLVKTPAALALQTIAISSALITLAILCALSPKAVAGKKKNPDDFTQTLALPKDPPQV